MIDNFNKIFSNFELYTNNTENYSKGVAICVRKGAKMIIKAQFFDSSSRMCGLECSFNNRNITLINVYAPNKPSEQCEFINELYEYLNGKKNIIMAGDFNFDTNRDNSGMYNIKSWMHLYRIFDLKEVKWCVDELRQDKVYTWTNGTDKSRIDRLLFQLLV